MRFIEEITDLFSDEDEGAKPVPEHPSIFQDYDIRGHYPTEINEETFFVIGRAIAKSQGMRVVVVGRDSRLSSLSLVQALSAGFLFEGVKVTDLGLCTTPQISWLSRTKKWHACMVTASHNHAPDNGIKVY